MKQEERAFSTSLTSLMSKLQFVSENNREPAEQKEKKHRSAKNRGPLRIYKLKRVCSKVKTSLTITHQDFLHQTRQLSPFVSVTFLKAEDYFAAVAQIFFSPPSSSFLLCILLPFLCVPLFLFISHLFCPRCSHHHILPSFTTLHNLPSFPSLSSSSFFTFIPNNTVFLFFPGSNSGV